MTEAEKAAEQINISLDQLKADLGNAVKKEDFEAVKTLLNDYIDKNKDVDMVQLKSDLSDIGTQLSTIKEKMLGFGSQENKTLKQVVETFITEKHGEITAAFKSGSGHVELVIDKAVATITTGVATPVGTVPDLFYQQYAPAPNVNLRQNSIMNMVTTLETSLAAYPYTETVPKDGDYAFLAEAATKPEIETLLNNLFDKQK